MTREELEADIRKERYDQWRSEQPECRQCGALWSEEDGIYDEDRGEYFCDPSCVAEYEQCRAEQIYERRYTGEGAAGAGEQREQMARWQRELKR